MSDQVVKNLPQSEACPFDFEVPQSVEWMLQSIIATYDGSGAGADFLPGVEIVGPGGVTTGIFADQSVKITAGSSGTVTFGTFLGRGGTATSTGLADHREITDLEQVIPAGGATATFSFVHNSGANLFDFSTATAPAAIVAGWYAINLYAISNGALTTGRISRLVFNAPSSLTLGQAYSFVGSGGATGIEVSPTPVWWFDAGDTFSVSVTNGEAGVKSFECQALIAGLF